MTLLNSWNGQNPFLLTEPDNRLTNNRVKKSSPHYIADFETTTDPEDCRVWGWGLSYVDYPDTVEIDHTLEEFIDRISYETSTCWFHNLKFDGMFIIDYLLKNDYFHVADSDIRSIGPKSFKTLISDMGKFYSMLVRWENGNYTEFRDSLKKLPMTVARIAQSFKLEESKGEIDYEKVRPVGYRMTEEERDYIRRDVSIVSHAMREVLNTGMSSMTVASDAMNEFKDIKGKKNFTRLFPIFTDEMDAEIRRAYRGGFTFKDSRRQGIQRSGIVLDVNSLYPSVMYNNILPYGEPQFIEGFVDFNERRPLSIFSVTFTAKLKPGHIPCIQIKGSSMFAPTEYLVNIDEPTTLMVTNIDWELYNDHYDIDVLTYEGGWRFHASRGLFDAYIDKWSAVKEVETGGKREIAKLHLNSLYGKFASNPNVTSRMPVLKDNMVKLIRGQDETRPPIYTAVGVFITSFARDLTIRAAQQNYDTFAYADTDSLHLLTDEVPTELDVHPTRMGAWKFEYAFDAAYYIRAKAYLERHSKTCPCKECKEATYPHYTNRIAGLPERISESLTFDDVRDGNVLKGKLVPITVPGGVVLSDIDYKLKL